MKKRCLSSAWIVGIVLLMGCSHKQSDLERIELKTLEGTRYDMGALQGKVVFINFWATWCKPCIQEMPTIAKAMETLQHEETVFLFPSNESVDLIEEFKRKRKFDFNFVQAQNMEELNIQVLPTTYIFDVNGQLIFNEAGFRDWSTPENIALISQQE